MAFPEFSGHSVDSKPRPKYERADLYLIDNTSKYKARPDALFQLKEEIMHKVMMLAYYRRYHPNKVPMLQEHWKKGFIVSKLFQHYYHMVHTADFDKIICKELKSRATEEREGYYLCQFDEDLMALINNLHNKPRHITPPLYYDKGRKIHTCYTGKFYARFEADCFRHETAVVRQAGQELFFAIYFNHNTSYLTRRESYEPMSYYNSEWIIPFLMRKEHEEILSCYGTDFRETYEIFKGLISFWYNFYF